MCFFVIFFIGFIFGIFVVFVFVFINFVKCVFNFVIDVFELSGDFGEFLLEDVLVGIVMVLGVIVIWFVVLLFFVNGVVFMGVVKDVVWFVGDGVVWYFVVDMEVVMDVDIIGVELFVLLKEWFVDYLIFFVFSRVWFNMLYCFIVFGFFDVEQVYFINCVVFVDLIVFVVQCCFMEREGF